MSLLTGQTPGDKPGIVPEIVDRYIRAARIQRTALRSEPMLVEITATLLKSQLKSQRQSELCAMRRVSESGQIAYDVLRASGDDDIRRQVIGRYLTAESQSRDMESTALTPLNYKFRLKGVVDRLGRRVHVLQLTPRKKKDGLFKGELWVDEATGLPVRESGQLVKVPHRFLKRLAFVRDYQLRDGLAVPAHDDITIDVRFWGRVALSIGFTNPVCVPDCD